MEAVGTVSLMIGAVLLWLVLVRVACMGVMKLDRGVAWERLEVWVGLLGVKEILLYERLVVTEGRLWRPGVEGGLL